MEKVEIGIGKFYNNYFALGISGYKMKKISNKDKYSLAFEIRNRLNNKKIESCFIRPLNYPDGFISIRGDELEAIVRAMSFNTNNKKLEIKLNNKIYIKNDGLK